VEALRSNKGTQQEEKGTGTSQNEKQANAALDTAKHKEMAFANTIGIQSTITAANQATGDQALVFIDLDLLRQRFFTHVWGREGGRKSSTVVPFATWLFHNPRVNNFPDDFTQQNIRDAVAELDFAIRQSSQGFQISHAGKGPSEIYAIILQLLVKFNVITWALAKLLLVWSPATHCIEEDAAQSSEGNIPVKVLSKATFYSRFVDLYSKAHTAQWALWLKYFEEPSTYCFNMALSNVYSPSLGVRRGLFPGTSMAGFMPQPQRGPRGLDFLYCEISSLDHFEGLSFRYNK
jgi:hypothetical protein